MTKEQSFSADSASVQERQVTIRVLTIGTKQVTQSLYKQLVSESVLDDNAQLKGNIWGWVNFHDDICRASSEKHLHVVWDDGNILKRYLCYKQPSLSSGYDKLYSQLKRIGAAYLCALALEESLTEDKRAETIKLSVGSRTLFLELPPAVKELFWAHQNHWMGQIDIKKDATIKALRRYLQASDLPLTINSSSLLDDKLHVVDDRLTAYEEAYKERFDKIEASGQLFIAVSGVWK